MKGISPGARLRVWARTGLAIGLLAILAGAAACDTAPEAARTDAQIRQEVVATLDAANLTDITVDVKDAIVTLGGEAPHQEAADRAIQLAKGAAGVREVENQIRVTTEPVPDVQPTPEGTRSAKLRLALLARSELAGSNITSSVDSAGVATLTGRVPSEEAKAVAERTARGLEGVTSVNNQLQVDPSLAVATVPDEEIQDSVTTALDTYFPDLLLTTTVKNGQVTVRGAVANRTQILKIAEALKQVKGVKNVDTHLLTVEGGEDERIGAPASGSE